MRWTRILATLPLVLLLLTLTSSPASAQIDPAERLERPDDPYLPAPRGAVTTPPAVVVAGPFVSVQVNLDANGNNIVGDAANEPSIAVNRTHPLRMCIGWRQFDTIASNFRQAGVGYTQDGGRSWTFPGVIDPGVFRSDPVLESDVNGVFYYNSLTVDGGDFLCDVYRSQDGGVTWDSGVPAFGGDKAWMAVDRSDSTGQGHIYSGWDWAGCCGDDWFTRSIDGGDTYQTPVAIPGQPIFGVVTTGPDGELYTAGRKYSTPSEFVVAKSTTARDPMVALSFDFASDVDLGGGLVQGAGPNPAGLLGQVWVDVDRTDGPDRGNVYVLASVNPPGSDPLDLHFVRSVDGGVTWSPPVRVNDDPVGNDAWQWFGTMAVAPDGRIDVIWNDTRDDPGGFDSVLYYAFSTDTGLTWSPGVPVSPSFDPHLGWPQQDKLGDYYDMVSDRVGAHVAYAATFNGEQDVYYLRIGDYDCNGNGVGDAEDIQMGTSQDQNGNEIPDECEDSVFVRGDDNGDGTINIADAAYGLEYLFNNGPSICLDAQDSNDDGVLNIADPTYTLAFLFDSGSPPPSPHPGCGADPTGDTLGCAAFSGCP